MARASTTARPRRTGPDGDALLPADAQLDPLSRRRRGRAGRGDDPGLAARRRARGGRRRGLPRRRPRRSHRRRSRPGGGCGAAPLARPRLHGRRRPPRRRRRDPAAGRGARGARVGDRRRGLHRRAVHADAGGRARRPAHGRRPCSPTRASASRSSSPRTAACRRWPTRSTSAPPSAGIAAGCSSTRGTSSAAASRGRCSARSTRIGSRSSTSTTHRRRSGTSSTRAGSAGCPSDRARSPSAQFADALAATGYDGVLSNEVLSSALRRRPPADGARELLESLHRSWPVDPLRTVEMN